MKLTYTKQQLEEAVKTSTCIGDILIKIGLCSGSSNYKTIRKKINEWNIDTTNILNRTENYTKQQLEEAVKTSISIRQVAIKIGISPAGGSYEVLKRKFNEWNIDASHIIKKRYSYLKKYSNKKKHLNEILIENSKYGTNDLRQRLIKEGHFIYQCSCCKLTEWRGNPISLELDHINGISNDHRIENLRLLCPNCHAQTDTYRGKNIKKW